MSTQRLFSAKLLLVLLSSVVLTLQAQADSINWRNNLDAAKIEAGRTGKPVLLHFYTSTCKPCKKLERDVFSQPQIAVAMERDYVPVKIDADLSPALASAFGISSVPTEIILSSGGKPIQKLSCPMDPTAYSAQLTNVAHHYRQRASNRLISAQTPIHSAYSGLKIGQAQGRQASPTTSPIVSPVTAAPATSPSAVAPAVTNNPYFAAAPAAAPAPSAAYSPVAKVPVAPAATVKTPAQTLATQQPALPANAMPNSYRNRYTTLPSQAPVAAKAPGVQASTAAARVVPATPPVAAAPAFASMTASPVAATSNQQQPAVASVEAWPPQLPVGTPAIAFDGYCPVSLRTAQKWVRGNKSFGAIHRGRTYLFANAQQQQQFLASPDAYSPVFSGNDPVKQLDENILVAGHREFGFEYRGAFYLFSSKKTMERFASQPDKYSAGVRQAMTRMDAASGTLRR